MIESYDDRTARRFDEQSDVSRPGTEFVQPGDPNYSALMREVRIHGEASRRAAAIGSGANFQVIEKAVRAELEGTGEN